MLGLKNLTAVDEVTALLDLLVSDDADRIDRFVSEAIPWLDDPTPENFEKMCGICKTFGDGLHCHECPAAERMEGLKTVRVDAEQEFVDHIPAYLIHK